MFRLFKSVNTKNTYDQENSSVFIHSNNNSSILNFPYLNKNTIKGIVIESEDIDFISVDSISIISPNGEILVPTITFKVT